jgi:hypothetical protein
MWCWGGDNTSRLCPSSGILKKHTFWKLDLFLSSGIGKRDWG